MPARSVVVQLKPGIGQAILPDHRKMLPGIQYVIDWDTFEKISNGARQNVISVVSVQNDATGFAGSFPAQTDNSTLQNWWSILVQTYATWQEAEANLAGFAAQGADGTSLTGLTDDDSFNHGTGTGLRSLTGPAGERYVLANICNGMISAGDVLTWVDESMSITSVVNAETINAYFQVRQDGQGTQYQVPVLLNWTEDEYNPAGTGVNLHSALAGNFAGILVANPAGGLPSTYIGWIQTEGFCPIVNTGGNVVNAGATLGVDPDSNVGVAISVVQQPVVVAQNGTVTGSALANNVFGTALTAADGDSVTTVQADLRSTSKVKKPYQRFLNRN